MTILDEIAAYTSKRMTADEEQVSTASLRRQALAMALAEREANGGAFPFGLAPRWQSRAFRLSAKLRKRPLRRGLLPKSLRILISQRATRRQGRRQSPV